jgi:DNA-binding transcriptional LysR family regulator
MDLKRLQTFVAVAEQGSVSGAAERLRVTQPALSRQIRDLQRDLGVALFRLVGRRLLLTGEGEEFLVHCRGLLGHAEAVADRARSLARGEGGVLRVAATPQVIESVFSGFLGRYARLRPGVQIRLTEAGGVEHAGMLARGEVHLATAIRPADNGRFAAFALPPVQVLVAHAPSFGLPAEGGDLDVGLLARTPLLLLRRGFGTRQMFDAACHLAGLDPVVAFEGGAAHALLALAEAGAGAAVLPSTVRTGGRPLRVSRLTCRGEPVEADFVVLWDGRRPLPRYAEGFPEAFDAYVREIWPISASSNAAGSVDE